MNKLAEFILSFFNLLEAEGRVLRQNALHFCRGCCFLVIGALFLAAALGLLAGAAYAALSLALPSWACLAIMGVVCAAIAAILMPIGVKWKTPAPKQN